MSLNAAGLYYPDSLTPSAILASGYGRTEQNRMQKGAPKSRVLGVAALFAALALAGCRTSEDDIHRWANTVQGPRKLVAVLTHDRYPLDLRVEAAISLIRMKPRSGRRVGIQGSDDQVGLIVALGQLPPAERQAIVANLLPRIEEEMRRPPPESPAGQATPDPSFPYKDAAFAILTSNSGALVPDDAQRASLRAALAEWSTSNFAERLDDPTQLYGVEQVMRELGAEGVRGLPALIEPGAPKIDRIAGLVADFGDPETRLAAGEKLVAVATEVNSEAWRKQKAAVVERANEASKLKPTQEQFNAQLVQYQEEELLRIFTSMKKVGGKAVVAYLLRFAQDRSQSDKLRASAMAALQGNLERNNPAHAEVPLALAGASDTPDQLRDVALARLGEFPRQMILGKLYSLFRNNHWKVRWVAAESVLKMSDASELATFFSALAQGSGFSITEPLRYGALIADMKSSTPIPELLAKYLTPPHPVIVRMSALGYYYQVGTKADLGKVQKFSGDPTPAPKCKDEAKECEWKCEVAVSGDRETKDILTLGDFVKYCVEPAMQARPGQK